MSDSEQDVKYPWMVLCGFIGVIGGGIWGAIEGNSSIAYMWVFGIAFGIVGLVIGLILDLIIPSPKELSSS